MGTLCFVLNHSTKGRSMTRLTAGDVDALITGLFSEFNAGFKDLVTAQSPKAGRLEDVLAHYPANVFYDDVGMHLDIAVVGVSHDEITVEADDYGLVKIVCKKAVDESRPASQYTLKKIVSKDFDFTIKIPAKYDTSKLSVKLSNGLLALTFPLADGRQTKTIKID